MKTRLLLPALLTAFVMTLASPATAVGVTTTNPATTSIFIR